MLVHDQKLSTEFSWQTSDAKPRPLYRCAIDLLDEKRGTSRMVVLNDLFRLLDLRHEIHEKAVMHRVVQAAIAMLSRALLLLGEHKPSLEAIVALGGPRHALQGEDLFFNQLAERAEGGDPRSLDAKSLIHKLIRAPRLPAAYGHPWGSGSRAFQRTWGSRIGNYAP